MGWMEVSLTEASLIESAESKFDKDRSMEVRLTETGLTVACCIKRGEADAAKFERGKFDGDRIDREKFDREKFDRYDRYGLIEVKLTKLCLMEMS
jgi:hypothetical protein